MIRFERVSVRYRPEAPLVLADADFTVSEGELAVVAGPTGAGKTTLLGCAAGLVPHFTGGLVYGRVVVGGRPPSGLTGDEWLGRDTRTHRPGDLADLVGYVGQDPAAGFVTETVAEELAYTLECLGTPPPVMRRRVEDVLDLLGLAPLRARRLRTLSGGEQQRVAIGAALTSGSRILALDEPTSALDPGGADDVLAAVYRLVHDLGVTALMTEHRLERALQFADRLIVVDSGRARIGDAAAMMRDSPVMPPVVQLGRLAGWTPLPVTVRDARGHAALLRRELAAIRELDMSGADDETTAAVSVSESGAGRILHGGGETSQPTCARATDLSVRRGSSLVLQRVDLKVRAGEVIAVMGRNGAGKSTLLSALAGLVDRESGDIDVGGLDPCAARAEQAIRHVGLVPQDPRLLLCANSVADECAGADADTRAGDGATRRVLERIAPELVRSEVVATHPDDLSEGQRLMLALSIVLAVQPALVLLDEPTRGLDYRAKNTVGEQLRSLAADGHGVVVATHDVEFVAELADRVVMLAGGEIVSDGPAAEVLLSTQVHTPQVAKVLRPEPWLTVTEVAAALAGAKERRG